MLAPPCIRQRPLDIAGALHSPPERVLARDESRTDVSASFTLPFDTRGVWGKAKVPAKVTINGYTWRSTVGNRGGIQYIVVNAEARRSAGVKAGDFVNIVLEPDSEKPSAVGGWTTLSYRNKVQTEIALNDRKAACACKKNGLTPRRKCSSGVTGVSR